MKKKILITLSILLFLAGLTVILYPKLQNLMYDLNTAHKEKVYFEKIDGDPAFRTALDDLYDQLHQYNIDLYEKKQDKLIDPFSYSQPNFDLSGYGIADNCIGYLRIDKININLPIYLGANVDNLRKGAVHLTETSFPIGGENTNAVIAAHRATTRIMFRNIHQLEQGDRVTVNNFRETLTYEVSDIKVISPTDVNSLLIQDGRDLITLISCHPYPHNYQRYVVFCERIGAT